MDSQVEEIKTRTDIVSLISQYMTLTRAGRNFKGLCPFHSERSPSFMVSPERGTWRCFGCGEHGDAITFLEKYENLTFIEALEQLAKKAGITLKKHNMGDAAQQKKRERLYDLLNLSAQFYHFLLTSHKLGEEARKYTADRKISDQTIKKYTLGYAPNSWHSLTGFLSKKGYTSQEMIEAGMASPGQKGVYDRYRGRLLFPVTDAMNRVVGFSGRILDADSKGPKYLNNAENEVFHKGKLLYGINQAKEAIRKHDRLILVEGNVDVLSSSQAGVEEVVAPLGTALTPEQISIIKRFTQNIYIAFDKDNAGVEAVRRSIDLLKQAELNIKIIDLIDGTDPDDCIKRNPQNWYDSINQAKEVFDYYLSWASKNFDLNTEDGKIRASQEILPLIAASKSKVAQAFLIQKTANALALSEEAIKAEMKNTASFQPTTRPQAQTNQAQTTPKPKPANTNKSREDVVSEYITLLTISLLSQDAPQKEVLAALKALDPQDLALHAGIMETIQHALKSSKGYDANQIVHNMSEEDREVFDRLILTPISSGLTDTGKMSHSIDDQLLDLKLAIRELRRLNLKNQLNSLSRSLKQAEMLDKQHVAELQSQFMALSQQLAQLQSENN